MFKNVKKEEITIPAQMSYLIQVRDFIEHIGKKYKFDDKTINSFKLVIDEACTNIIRHGYRDIKNGEITIKAIIRRLSLTILMIDQGISYDPRQANTPDLEKYVNIGKKGGLGIMMMRKLMDDIQYTVTERGNEFRLTKYRENTQEPRLVRWWHEQTMRSKYAIYASLLLTLILGIIFLPQYYSVTQDVQKNLLKANASSSQTLANGSVEDLLDDNNILLFEKAHALVSGAKDIIYEVYIVDTLGKVLAWGDPIKHDVPPVYLVPESASLVDTVGRTKIFYYSLNDTLPVFDITSEALLAGETSLGRVHVLITRDTVLREAEARKMRLIINMLVILLLGYVAIFFFIRYILSPFHHLADWVRQVVQGKVDQDEIDIDASDELGEIAQAFNEMTHKFREAQVTLMEQQKLQKELQVAQEIQQMLLPSDFPKVEGYEIASYYEAAKEVGGDLFDFVEVDKDTIGICVADVSGKGVPGSLIMTMIRTALRLESRGNKNPADVLAKVNRFVADDMKRGMFVTMFYVILDSRNRIIHYASAGHNPMILYRGSTRQTYYLNPSGFPVGIQLPDISLFDRKIETDSIRLREDDILVLYTDGITEAMNANRELFREERFLDAIRNNAHMDVGEFIKAIQGEIKQFTGGAPQNDDITFVAIKEKMMQSDVIYNIQRDLQNLINNGMKVKDALEKLRVSQYHYYKYKEIIDKEGLAGLKSVLDKQDYIEKKHLSIEVKTKIYDIIRKHPEYGASRIVKELEKDEYGNVKLDANRLYKELVKMHLNTRARRERFVQKGDKGRLKQPGTPLLTLDGKVILDFKSSEEEIGKRRASQDIKAAPFRPKPVTEEHKKPFVKEFTAKEETVKKEEPVEAENSAAVIIHKPAKTHEEAEPRDIKDEKPEQAEPAREIEIEEKQAAEIDETETIETKESISKPRPQQREQEIPQEKPEAKVKPETAEKKVSARAVDRNDLLTRVSVNIDRKILDTFFEEAKEDLESVEKLLIQVQESNNLRQTIKDLHLHLRRIVSHPTLSAIPDAKRIFERIQHIIYYIDNGFDKLDEKIIRRNVKELLFSVKKDDKFVDYERYYETINILGVIQKRFIDIIAKNDQSRSDAIAKARKKLAGKNIITSKPVLNMLNDDPEIKS